MHGRERKCGKEQPEILEQMRRHRRRPEREFLVDSLEYPSHFTSL